MKKQRAVLFRCDGSPELGLGHIVRCLALADELKNHNINIYFAIRKGPLGIRMVEEKGYRVFTSDEVTNNFDYGKWIDKCAIESCCKAIIFDVRDGLSRAIVRKLRNKGILTVTIDDPEDKRLEMDLAFYPPVPQVKRMDWSGFTGELYIGWDWVILRPEFAAWRQRQNETVQSRERDNTLTPRILITMGGSDPAGLTLKAVEALNMLHENFQAMIVLGPGFMHEDPLNKLLRKINYNYTIIRNVLDMAPIMAQADLAIASFGVTAFELAALGVPAIHLCLTEDHVESASTFVKAGIAVSLGLFNNVSKPVLANAIRQLLVNAQRRSIMSDRAKQKVDGQGATKIIQMIEIRVKDING